MNVIEAILSRTSRPRLCDPGPDDDALGMLFRCAGRAPDHGLLRPWRFVVFRGEARHALGEILAGAEQVANPAATADSLAKIRGNPLRAPVVVACVACVDPGHPKVPRVEQVSAVAAAVQNMQLAADALGFGAMWRTGPLAASPLVKQSLGFDEVDEIVAFLYLGTPEGDRRAAPAIDPAVFVREWGRP